MSTSTDTMASSASPFPFDSIVVTTPDASAAQAAREGPLVSLRAMIDTQFGSCNGNKTGSDSSCTLSSRCDPYESRCGSGGGTLAALHDSTNSTGSSATATPPTTTLIVHAGGDSSRCPTQMVLGKAWTSLPTQQPGHAGISNPTDVLVATLGRVFSDIPTGSIVVAASDTMLQLMTTDGKPLVFRNNDPSSSSSSNNSNDDNAVYGVAVPAPFETAKNHGVFVMNDGGDGTKGNDNPVVQEFLQKPSIETLQSRFQNNKQLHRQAWIDTGVVVFPPKAAAALRSLGGSDGVLTNCTDQGLEASYQAAMQQQQQQQNGSTNIVNNVTDTPSVSLQQFAQQHALKVDLYTHIVLALSMDSKRTYLEAFVDELPPNVLEGIYDTLSPFTLNAFVLPKGRFLHLGTSREMLDFLVHDNDDDGFGLVKQRHNHYPKDNCTTAPSSVVLNSCFVGTNESSSIHIGESSVVEHCHIVTSRSVSIGQNCLVSGWRGTYHDHETETRPNVVIPNETILQVLPIKIHTDKTNNTVVNSTHQQKDGIAEVPPNHFVCIYLGLHDDIKKWKTLYGRDVDTIAFPNNHEKSSDGSTSLWDADETKQNLWTARIHPVWEGKDVPVNIHDLFGWIARGETKPSTAFWSSRRVSLQDIRRDGNALSEWRYRHQLQHQIIPTESMVDSLLRREPLAYQLDQHVTRQRMAQCVQRVLVSAIPKRKMNKEKDRNTGAGSTINNGNDDDDDDNTPDKTKLDVCGRALMLLGMHLESLSAAKQETEQGTTVRLLNNDQETTLLRGFHCENMADWTNSCRRLHQLITDESACSQELSLLATKASHAITEACCVCRRSSTIWPRTSPTPTKHWVLAKAPARIDLAGGWSDTPPVCYEHGGAVCGMAVLVDDCKPLLCLSRIVPGACGIRLTIESRQAESEEKSSQQDKHATDATAGSTTNAAATAITKSILLTKVRDLQDCRDPTSDCALLKCALVHLGLLGSSTNDGPSHWNSETNCVSASDSDEPLQPFINRFCQSPSVDVGLEVRSISLLPHGSGMGTSSILGGCVLASIAKCVGIDYNGSRPNDTTQKGLVDCVLELEQLLTTGGGWQDQIGGLVGGVKIGRSEQHRFAPLHLTIEPIVSTETDVLNKRFLLAFTGKTRLAKNLLQNVLRRWARRTDEIVATVDGLVRDAEKAAKAIRHGDLTTLGGCLNRYRQHKQAMAGEGAEPAVVTKVLDKLQGDYGLVEAGALCGAGGGGFLAVLVRDGVTKAQVETACADIFPDGQSSFVWHDCSVSSTGLEVSTIAPSQSQGDNDNDNGIGFDMEWVRPLKRQKTMNE